MSAVGDQPVQALAAQKGRGRHRWRLASGAGRNGPAGRFAERAKTVPRVAERSYVDLGMRNLGQQRSSLRQSFGEARSVRLARQHAERIVDPERDARALLG